MSTLVRRTPSPTVEGASGGCVLSAAESSRFPALAEFLGATAWPDGTTRIPGSISLFVEEGRLKACISDRDQGLVAFVTGRGLDDLFRVVEETLLSTGGDWRPSKARQPKRK